MQVANRARVPDVDVGHQSTQKRRQMLVVVMGRRLEQVLVREADVLAGQQPARPLATHVRPLPLEVDREKILVLRGTVVLPHLDTLHSRLQQT